MGCEAIYIDYIRKVMIIGDKEFKEGVEITINGSNGNIYQTSLSLIKPEFPDAYYTLMKWADEFRRLRVRDQCRYAV